jgi:hypothetical protein
MSVVHCPGIVLSCLGRESEWTSSFGNRTTTRVTIRAAQNAGSRQLAHWREIFNGQSSKWSQVKFWLITRSAKCSIIYRRITELTEDEDEIAFPVGHRKRFFELTARRPQSRAGFACGRAWGRQISSNVSSHYWKENNTQFSMFTTKGKPKVCLLRPQPCKFLILLS